MPNVDYANGDFTAGNCFTGYARIRCLFLIVALLLLTGAGAWSEKVDVRELDTTAGRTVHFVSYEGPPKAVQTVPQIEGIGEVLSRKILAGSHTGHYFGKYTVVRAWQPSERRLLSADIIIFSPSATVDDIRNVQRMVAGYLATAFGYNLRMAIQLAGLVTKYNAAYRGNIAALSLKYTPLVMSYLTAENAGIATDYRDWPGKTRLIVPLSPAGGPAGAAPRGPAAGAASPRGQAPAAGSVPSGGVSAAGGVQPGPGGASAAGSASPGGGPAVPPQAGGASTSGSVQPGGAEAAGGAAGGPSASAPSGRAFGPTSPSGGPAASGPTGPVSSGQPRTGYRPGLHFNWFWLLAIAALLLLALLVWLLVLVGRRILQPSYDREVRRSALTGHPLVEMIVVPQNRRIGHRNIHYLRPGSSASVGSGRATFLIYFVSVPRRIALLKYDGRTYTFVPITVDLFPGVKDAVPDCLGKPIPARSLRGYRFTIIFHKFVPPLEEINLLMRSTFPRPPSG